MYSRWVHPLGWKIEWGYQPWQLKTYHQQSSLTLQAGWKDKVDIGLDLHRDIQYKSDRALTPIEPCRVLTPIDLDALEARASEEGVETDICRLCHV